MKRLCCETYMHQLAQTCAEPKKGVSTRVLAMAPLRSTARLSLKRGQADASQQDGFAGMTPDAEPVAPKQTWKKRFRTKTTDTSVLPQQKIATAAKSPPPAKPVHDAAAEPALQPTCAEAVPDASVLFGKHRFT